MTDNVKPASKLERSDAGMVGADTRSREIPPMTTDIRKFLIAYETKWRSRVGTTNAYDCDPYARVGRNEMQGWCKDNGLKIDLLLDAAEVQPPLNRLFSRLKREFPDERW